MATLEAPAANGVAHGTVHKMPSSSTIGLEEDEDMTCVSAFSEARGG
jgi:hypothetical protein